MQQSTQPVWLGFICCGAWHIMVMAIGFALGQRARRQEVEIPRLAGGSEEEE